MKKATILTTLTLLLALLFVVNQVFASPAESVAAKKTPSKTPGAQATQRAIERASKTKKNPHGQRLNYKGEISAVDAASLTLNLEDGSSMTFNLTEETRIKVPTLGKSAGVENLQPGCDVRVHALLDDEGGLTALMVLVIPGKPQLAHHVGVVSDYQPDISLTIQARDGNFYTFLLTPDTKILPAERAEQLDVGMRVTVIAPRDVATSILTAKGIVVHPEGSGAGSLLETSEPVE